MTDIHGWPHLIRKERAPEHPSGDCPEHLCYAGGGEYFMLPFNDYQLGNLLGLLKRSQDKHNGDWFLETASIVYQVMKRLEVSELGSNWGDQFTADTLKDGTWLH